MTKSAKRILIAVLSTVLLVCTALFAAACDFDAGHDDGAYTVTLEYEQSQGTVWLDPDYGFYAYGDDVTVHVEPENGYIVDEFFFNGLERTLTEEGTYSFTVGGYVTITVTFKPETVARHRVTLGYNGEGEYGTVNLNPSGNVAEGTEVKGTIKPDEHYEVEDVTVNGKHVDFEGNTFTFTVEEGVDTDYAVYVTFKPKTYTVTIGASEHGTLKLDHEEGDIEYNTKVVITVSDIEEGYEIDEIKVDGSTLHDDDGYYFFVEGDTEVSVTYTLKTYTVTLDDNAEDHGTVTLDPEKGKVIHGNEITITVKADEHYDIVEVKAGETILQLEDGVYKFTVTGNTTIYVTYAPKTYTVTVGEGADEHGTVTLDPANGEVVYNNDITITVEHDEHYDIVVKVGDETLEGQDGIYTYTVTGDVTITVEYTAKSYTVSIDNSDAASQHGTVTLNPAEGDIEYGTKVEIKIEDIEEGYVIDEVIVNADPIDYEDGYFFNVKGETTVKVTFKKDEYSITLDEPEDSYGEIELSHEDTVEHGDIVTITIKNIAEGYKAFVTVNGGAVEVHDNGDGTYTFTATSEVTIKVTYEKIQLTVNFSTDGNGTLTADNGLTSGSTVEYGSEVTFTFEAKEHYEIDQVLVDEEPIEFSGNTFTVTNITAETTIYVTFKAITFNVTLNVTNENGNSAEITDSGEVQEGKFVTVTVTLAEGYEVDEFTVSTDAEAKLDGSLTYTFEVKEDTEITVTFKKIQVTVTVEETANGSVTLSTANTVDYGTSVTVTVTPDTGYEVATFTVSNDETAKLEGNTYTFEAKENVTITVTFEKKTYTVTLDSNATEHGNVTLSAENNVEHGTTVTITVSELETGYEVDEVTLSEGAVIPGEGGTYTFTITGDTTVYVTYKLTKHKVELSVEGNHGTAEFDDISSGDSVDYGTTVTGTVTPESEHYVVQVTVNGDPVEVKENKFEFKVTKETTVVVTFKAVEYSITMNVGANGSASRTPDTDKVAYGATIEVTLEPNDGYNVEVTVNGDPVEEITDNKFSFTVKGETTIEITFYKSINEAFVGTWSTQNGDAWGTHSFNIAKDGTVTVDGGTATASFSDTSVTVNWNSSSYTLSFVSDYSDALYVTSGTSIGYLFRDGAKSSVTSFDSLAGTYAGIINSVSVIAVIGEDGILFNEEETIVIASSSTSYTLFWHGVRFNLTQNGEDLRVANEGSQYFGGYFNVYATFTKQKELSFSTEYIGTWKATGHPTMELIEITANSFTIDSQVPGSIAQNEYNYSFSYNGISYYMNVHPNYNGNVLQVWVGTTYIYFVKDDAVSPVKSITSDYDGNWEGSINGTKYFFAINSAAVTISVNGVQAFIAAESDAIDKPSYTLVCGGYLYILLTDIFYGFSFQFNGAFDSYKLSKVYEIPEEIVNPQFAGTWVLQNGDTRFTNDPFKLVIDVYGNITINGIANEVTITSDDNAEKLKFTWNGINYEFTVDDEQYGSDILIGYTYTVGTFYLFRENANAPITSYEESFHGYWRNGEQTITIEIDESKFEMNEEQVFVYKYTPASETENKTVNAEYAFFWHGTPYRLTIVEGSKQITGGGFFNEVLTAADAPVTPIPTNYYGTWQTAEGDPNGAITVTIESDGTPEGTRTVKVGGETYNLTANLTTSNQVKFVIRNEEGNMLTLSHSFDEPIEYFIITGDLGASNYAFLWKDGNLPHDIDTNGGIIDWTGDYKFGSSIYARTYAYKGVNGTWSGASKQYFETYVATGKGPSGGSTNLLGSATDPTIVLTETITINGFEGKLLYGALDGDLCVYTSAASSSNRRNGGTWIWFVLAGGNLYELTFTVDTDANTTFTIKDMLTRDVATLTSHETKSEEEANEEYLGTYKGVTLGPAEGEKKSIGEGKTYTLTFDSNGNLTIKIDGNSYQVSVEQLYVSYYQAESNKQLCFKATLDDGQERTYYIYTSYGATSFGYIEGDEHNGTRVQIVGFQTESEGDYDFLD